MAVLAAKKVESGGDRKRINNLPIGQVTVKMVLLIDIKPSSALLSEFSLLRLVVRARSHCGKQNAKRCVFMTVARQICSFEYGVSLSCKRGLKRTQTKTGVSDGGEKIHANVNAAKRELRNALFSSQKPKIFGC